MIAIILSPFLAAQAASTPSFRIEAEPGGYRVIAGPFPEDKSAALREAAEAAARRQCGVWQVAWGEFEYRETVSLENAKFTVHDYRHSFRCVTPAETAGSVDVLAVAGDWAADAIEEAAARNIFRRYWTAVRAGELEAAVALFKPGALADPLDHVRQLSEAVRLSRSAEPAVTRLSWYVNSAGAPEPGAYAALDHRGASHVNAIECGYLLLHRVAPGRYLITRQERNLLKKGADAALTTAFEAQFCLGG